MDTRMLKKRASINTACRSTAKNMPISELNPWFLGLLDFTITNAQRNRKLNVVYSTIRPTKEQIEIAEEEGDCLGPVRINDYPTYALPEAINLNIIQCGPSYTKHIKDTILKNRTPLYEDQTLSASLTQFSGTAVTVIRAKQIYAFNNSSEDIIYVLSHNWTQALYECVLCCLPLMTSVFKWTQEEPFKDIFLKIAQNEDITDVLEILDEKEKKENQKKLIESLTKLIERPKKEKIENLKYGIRSCLDCIKDYNQRINDQTKRLRDYEEDLEMVIHCPTKNTNKVEEIIEYMQKIKYITDINFENNSLVLTIDTPITIYDSEALERVLNRRLSEYTDLCKASSDSDKMQYVLYKILQKIFLEEKYTLYTSTNIKLNWNSISIGAEHEDTTFYESSRYMPQPHLAFFNCFGSYKDMIIQALKEYDIIRAISVILASCQNMNFTDLTVFDRFLDRLKHTFTNKKGILDKETGEFVSYKDLFKKYNFELLEEVYENKADIPEYDYDEDDEDDD